MEKLEDAIRKVDARVEKENKKIVLREYTPLFTIAMKEASSQIIAKKISEIKIGRAHV